jgi:hypothetical protein
VHGGWENEGVASPGPTRIEREPGWALVWRERAPKPKRLTRKRLFVALLVGWNAFWLGCIGYTAWMRHHPNVQAWQTNLQWTIALWAIGMGSLVILGVGAIVRWIVRRPRSSTVA